jgi:predicted PurR-regulated permease PerM
MTDPREPASGDWRQWAIPVLLMLATLGLGWILVPVYGPILWAVVIALLFAPLQRRLMARLRGRHTLAALLTLLVVLLVVVLPFVLVTASVASEAAGVYQRIQSGEMDVAGVLRRSFTALPDGVMSLLARLGLGDFDDLQRRLTLALAQGTQFIATQALSVGQNAFEFIVGLFITLYLAFFLIRDGAALALTIRRAIPLPAVHQQALVDRFVTVIRAAVKGNLVVAMVQGSLGGLAFWVLGVGAALLGGVLMAALSLLPAVGAALVWVPVAAYLVLTGAIWQGVALTLWGVFVIGLVDNLLRPILVGKTTRMPDYLVMITTLGGIAVFGINGFVLGPVIAAMFIAVWHIASDNRAD